MKGLRLTRILGIPLLVSVIVTVVFLWGALEGVELLTLDFRLRVFSRNDPAPVAFAVIDSNTLKKIGSWPIPRGLYAKALDRIMGDGPRVVLMDIDFSSRGPDPKEDLELIGFMRNVEDLVLAVQMEERRIPEGAIIRGVSLPMNELLESSPALGSITFEVDPDGVVRRIPAPIDLVDRLYHPMGIVGARFVDPGVPLNYTDGALINMSGKNLHSFPVVSFERILEGDFVPGVFQDRIVILGATSSELHDFWLTPLGVVPGIYIQAALVETVLNRSWHIREGLLPAVILIFLASLILGYFMGRASWLRGLGYLAGYLVLVAIAAAVFASLNRMINLVPLISVALLQYPFQVAAHARWTEKTLALSRKKTDTILKFSELKDAEDAGRDPYLVPLVLLQQVIGLERILLYLSDGEAKKGWQIETVIGNDAGGKAGNLEIIGEVAAKGTVVLESGLKKNQSVVYVPMSTATRNLGVLYAEGPGKVFEDNDNIRMLLSHATQTAYFLEVHELDRQVRSLYSNTIKAILKALESKDFFTGAHSELSQKYVEKFGRICGLNAVLVEALHIGALLHDIGKIGVPDRILNNPGRLTEEEFEVIKQHPEAGFEIIKDLPFPHDVKMIVKHHHEHYDGSGYPDGLKGDHIPLLVRIFSVLDVYEALIGQRPYKESMDPVKAKDVILEGAGTQFDPQIVKIFLSIF